mgnify:FL=1
MGETAGVIRLHFNRPGNRTGRQPSTWLLDAPIFTVCPNCGFTPPEARRYVGSRYGLVGSFTCAACGAKVTITDGDCYPPVRFTADLPGKPQVSFVYEDVYRLNWADLERAGAALRTSLIPPGEKGYVDVEAALRALEAEIARRGLPHASAPLPDGVTWVPLPLRAWLDALHTLGV